MKIDGQNISMTRGDSETITVAMFNEDGTPHPFVTGDKIYFTVKEFATHTDKIMQKVITVFDSGNAIIEITPNDTKLLPFKSFVYDIQLTRSNLTVTTIVPISNFEILKEVTHE